MSSHAFFQLNLQCVFSNAYIHYTIYMSINFVFVTRLFATYTDYTSTYFKFEYRTFSTRRQSAQQEENIKCESFHTTYILFCVYLYLYWHKLIIKIYKYRICIGFDGDAIIKCPVHGRNALRRAAAGELLVAHFYSYVYYHKSRITHVHKFSIFYKQTFIIYIFM